MLTTLFLLQGVFHSLWMLTLPMRFSLSKLHCKSLLNTILQSNEYFVLIIAFWILFSALIPCFLGAFIIRSTIWNFFWICGKARASRLFPFPGLAPPSISPHWDFVIGISTYSSVAGTFLNGLCVRLIAMDILSTDCYVYMYFYLSALLDGL